MKRKGLTKKAPKCMVESMLVVKAQCNKVKPTLQKKQQKGSRASICYCIVLDGALFLVLITQCHLFEGGGVRRQLPLSLILFAFDSALGDQLYGDQHKHDQLRSKIVSYMEQYRDDFEPFMEDEEKFEKYCHRMREDGTWGGNQELYAAARLFQVCIILHQDQPSARIMVIECDRLKPTRLIHVAYHGEDHYDSVRSLKDSVDLDTVPVAIELDCDGFRARDFMERWHAQFASTTIEQLAAMGATDGRVTELTSRFDKELHVTAGPVCGPPLSKKEVRKLKKHDKTQRVPSRKK